jgi:hypothetical protein
LHFGPAHPFFLFCFFFAGGLESRDGAVGSGFDFGLAGFMELIYELQSVTGKILSGKELGGPPTSRAKSAREMVHPPLCRSLSARPIAGHAAEYWGMRFLSKGWVNMWENKAVEIVLHHGGVGPVVRTGNRVNA